MKHFIHYTSIFIFLTAFIICTTSIPTYATNDNLNNFSQYLISTDEVTFSKDDDVCKKVDELCEGLPNTASKVAEIYNFIYTNISYDYNLAEDIKNGKVKTYIPNAIDTLNSKKGICFDFSVLFATMCRSQDIPCYIEKGYYGDTLHSWNKVYVENKWYVIDSTVKLKHNLENEIFYKARRLKISKINIKKEEK